ncbi:hypothetical protein M0R45_001727 [Rubus argutus]|uniref:Uncharacterized protein n=1 Tax=Rubus argutus TaxID=59490 RepID=A0AAW1VJH5_RUBAR
MITASSSTITLTSSVSSSWVKESGSSGKSILRYNARLLALGHHDMKRQTRNVRAKPMRWRRKVCFLCCMVVYNVRPFWDLELNVAMFKLFGFEIEIKVNLG